MVPGSQFRPYLYSCKCLTALLLLGSQEKTPGTTYDWNTTVTPGSWSVAANWTGAPSAGGPDGAGDFVTIGTDISAATVTNLFNTGDAGAAAKTVGVLNTGDLNTSHSFTIQAGSGSGSLIFNNSGSGAQLNQLATSRGDTVSASSSITDSVGLTISNASANLFTVSGGLTSSGSAVLNLNSNSTGGITLSGSVNHTGTITNNGAGAGTTTISGAIGSSVTGLTQSSSTSQLTLSGTANTFSGTVSAAPNSRLQFTSDGTLGNSSNGLVLGAGSTLIFGGNSALNPLRAVSISGGVTAGVIFAAQQNVINGNITGTGGLINKVSGELLLTGDNSYGITTLDSGMVGFSSHANIGGAASTLALQNSGGGFLIRGIAVTNLSSHPINFAGFGGLTLGILDRDNSFTWDKNCSLSLNSAIGTAFAKSGPGTVTIVVPQTHRNVAAAGIGTGVNGGILKVDYGAGGSLAAANNNLSFGGGTLHLLGKGGTQTTAQTLGNVKLNAGGGNLVVDNRNGSGSTTLTLGNFSSLTAASGSSLNIRTINPGSGSSVVTTTQLNDASGIIGAGRVLYNGTDFATNSTNLSGGTIGGYPGYTAGLPGSGSDGSTNYSQTDSGTVSASESVNTLKIATTTSGQSLGIGSSQTLTLNSGALLFIGAHDYSITGGTLASNIATNSDLIIHQYGSGVLTIGSVIANGVGASTLTKTGSGTLELTSPNTYTGQTYVNEGTLRMSNTNQLGAGASTLNLNGTLQTTATFSLGRPVVLGGNGGVFDVANGTTLTESGVVSGLGFTLTSSNGSGTLILSGSNLFTGGLTIEAGILRQNNSNALNSNGLNSLAFGSGITAKLQLNGFNAVFSGLTSGSANAVIENASNTTSTLRVNNGADNTYAGVIQNGTGTGVLSFIKGGIGILTLTGANSYTGTTSIHGGTLQFGDGTAGHDGSISNSSNITNHTNLIYNTFGSSSYSGIISGPGSVTKKGAGTMTLSGNHTYTGTTVVSGGTLVVSGSLAPGSLAVDGSSSTFNYTNGSAALTRNVTVTGGATFKYNSAQPYAGTLTFTNGTLSGSGNFGANPITIGANNVLSPGNSPGTASFGATQTWSDGGNYLWEINNPSGSAGNDPGWDLAAITGQLNLASLSAGGFTLTIDSLNALAGWDNSIPQAWNIAITTGGVNGFAPGDFTLDTAAFADQNALGGGAFSLAVAGNNLLLQFTPIPEASPGALLFIAIALAFAPRRPAHCGRLARQRETCRRSSSE